MILPWNSPLLLLGWKLVTALAAGCTVVAKPAEQTPASTLEFATLFEEAGFPPGVVNVVTGGAQTGRALVRHPDVDKVAFTGSSETGISVMKDAAEHRARVSLELGGKSPNIVFSDADLQAAGDGVIAGIFAATGQTCMAGSRLLVDHGSHDELVWPGRGCVDDGCEARPSRRPCPARGHGLDQRLPDRLLQHAVRRLQTKWVR
jgi:(Z)-2-((N-methylformamido)methylene)-5-hydroxybutyrolactone dehydrogenase